MFNFYVDPLNILKPQPINFNQYAHIEHADMATTISLPQPFRAGVNNSQYCG